MNDTKLPDSYDQLINIKKLEWGEHNPRRVSPSDELLRDIDRKGIRQPLVVRPKDGTGQYHITDGWQRYQAASELGWEKLPVNVYENLENALIEAESQSIGREWGTYEWAQHCESVATTLDIYKEQDVITEVTDRVSKTRSTVQKYLQAMRLPGEVIRTVVDDAGRGDESDWAALKHYNDDAKKYDGITWKMAAELGKRYATLDENEMIEIAAHAVHYKSNKGVDFINLAVNERDRPISEIHKMLALGKDHTDYLTIQQTAIRLEEDKQQSLINYCANRRRNITEIVEEMITEFADVIYEEEENPPSVREFLEWDSESQTNSSE